MTSYIFLIRFNYKLSIWSSTLRSLRKLPSFLPISDSAQKVTVYWRVPWIGKLSTNLEKEVKTAVESCYGSVSTRLVFTSKRMLPVARKDVLPTTWKIFVTCEYKFFFFFWKGSTFSDAGSDGTQPASCVDIQNRHSTYSCRCPMYGACQNDVFCGLFCSATLAIRCRSKAPFVHERLKTPNTSPQAIDPDP